MGINEDLEKEELKKAKIEARKKLEEQILELKEQQAEKAHEQFEVEVKMEAQKAAAAKREAENQMDLASAYQIQLEILTAQGDLTAAEQTRLEALVKTHRDAALAAQETADAASDTADALKDAAEYGENLITRLTGISDKPKSFAGKLLADPGNMIKGLMAAGSKMITPMNVLTSSVDKVVEATAALALESDQAVVNFRKSTGASGEFDSTIRNLERSLYGAGVTSAEAGEAVQSLFLNVTGFTEMGPETVKQVGETVAMLAELGVNSKTTAENIQFATKVMSMSGAQAEELTRDLFTFAQELQVSGDQIASDFAAMGPTIAALGEQGVQAFKDLQVQSKATGLAMDTMLKITGQFDTFADAAQSVGKLNALLGGPYLNTLEMVTETDPSKRMDLMRDATLNAGLAFDDLSYYQKKAYTSALGLNNEMELAMFLGGNMDQIAPPQKSAAEMEELAKQTAQFNTIMDELTQAGMAFAVALGPLISGIKQFLNFIHPVFKVIGDILPVLEPLAVALGLVAVAWALMTIAATPWMWVSLAIIGGLAILNKFLGPGGLFAAGLLLAIPALLAFGTALSFSTAGLLPLLGLLVTFGIYLFKKIASPGLIEMLGMAAAAMFLLPPAIAAFALGLMILLPFLPILGVMMWYLMKLLPQLAAGFALIAASVGDVFTETFINNLRMMAIEIANIVDKINELDTVKATAFTVTTVATAGAAAVNAAAAGVFSAPTTTGATASAGAGASGPPPVINVHLSVDGTEFATAVNKVEIEKYVAGTKSDMHASIVDMLKEGFLSSS